MNVYAVIVEQLDAIEDRGYLTSVRLFSPKHRPITVSYAREYRAPRSGPFHFYDFEDEERLKEEFAIAEVRELGDDCFSLEGEFYTYQTAWYDLPTEPKSQGTTYYALSFPIWAVPTDVRITDPYRPDHEYERTVQRDDTRNCYVLYLPCRSALGTFSFRLKAKFRVLPKVFRSEPYVDSYLSHDAALPYAYRTALDGERERDKADLFMEAARLALILEHLRPLADSEEKRRDIRLIEQAELAAKSGDQRGFLEALKRLGLWVLDGTRDISTDLLARVIAHRMSLGG